MGTGTSEYELDFCLRHHCEYPSLTGLRSLDCPLCRQEESNKRRAAHASNAARLERDGVRGFPEATWEEEPFRPYLSPEDEAGRRRTHERFVWWFFALLCTIFALVAFLLVTKR